MVNPGDLSSSEPPTETPPDDGSEAPETSLLQEQASNGSAPAVHDTPTRVSASWTAVVIAVFLLVLLVIFIAENTQRSTVNFLGLHGHAPTAVALLIAAIAGAGIVVVVGVARILQLRRKAKQVPAKAGR